VLKQSKDSKKKKKKKKDIVLERRWGIAQAKRHNQGLEQTEPCDKCCFPLMSLRDTQFVEGCDNVEFRIYLGITKCVEGLSYQWERVSILNCDIVQAPVVLADPYAATRLRRKEKGGHILPLIRG
jgi:hypothetical protein